jgi:uncharacterized protein (UPF0332 family)
MMPEQAELLLQARDSLDAAKILHGSGHYGFSASRAYYTMFYVVEAFLLGKRLAFSKHSGVHAAFGENFVKTGIIPSKYHRYLIRAMEVRHAGDYGGIKTVNKKECEAQIARARQFLELAQELIGPLPAEDEKADADK